jgi:WD40 repeat protein
MTAWDDPSQTLTGDATHRPATTLGPTSGPILGRGGEGLVVAGRDRHLPRDVAWKVVPADDHRGIARLENEAALLASLEHPSIVPVYDLVRDTTSVRLALKQIHGQTLSAAVSTAPSTADRLRLLPHLLAACHAVAWAHHKKILHRDLKSANVMVGAFGETQVIDWGLACPTDAPTPGAVVGTPQSMSPEQARGEAVDERSDVWGLGTILVEIITGRPLFTGTDPRLTLDNLAHGKIPAWSTPADIPRALTAIAERALAPTPEHRYPDALALAHDLAALLDGRLVTAHRYSAWETFARFARTFRVPIAVGLTLAVTATVAAFIAYDRITDERDTAIAATHTANTALAAAGLSNARRELDDDFRAEAELAAAQVLAVSDHPEARGILAAFARAPRPTLTDSLPLSSTPPICRDADLSPAGTHLLCGDADRHLTRIDLTTGQRETLWSAPYITARFAGPRVVISRPTKTLTLISDTGAVTHHPGCGGQLVVHGDAVVDFVDACLTHLASASDTPTPPLRPCPAKTLLQSATAHASGYAALCTEGTLVVTGPHLRSVPTELVSPVGNFRTMTPLDGDTLLIGVSDGELIVLDHHTGHILRRAYVRPRRLIRSVTAIPTTHTLLAQVDGLGPLLLHTDSLAPFARLPRDERQTWMRQTTDGLALTSVTADLRSLHRWHLPIDGDPTIHLQEGRIGITSISLDAHDSLGLTYSEHAELADARSGETLERTSWPNLESGIAKAVARDGPGAWVAVGSPALPRVLTADPGPLVGLGGLRRIYPLRPPDAGPPRFIAINIARGLRLIDHDGSHVLSMARFTDLHALGTTAAALTAPPRMAHVYDLTFAPHELATCPVPDAQAVTLLLLPDAPSPLILVADHSGLSALDLDCRLVADFPSRGEPLSLAATPYASPTRAIVAAGTREGHVEIWDWSGRLLATVRAHTFPVRALDFTPDATTLASGAWDGRLRFYDIATLLAPTATLIAAVRDAWPPQAL